MDRKDKVRACYQHIALLYVSNKRMTNSTLRERFKILEQDYPIASRIIDVEVLSKWEEGEALPSIPQLRKLGEIYKRPLAVFFLSEPPPGFDPQREFRRLPGVTPQNESPELRLALHSAQFWLTVQSLCPEADSAKQWLRFNGSKLRCDLKRVCGSA
jgi:DNA-binding transcriptional regulator YiaG